MPDPIFRIDYILGADGNRLGALETRGADLVRWRYKYDLLGRLIQERRDIGDNGSDERDVSYTYDSDGNRIALTDNNDSTKSRTYEYYAGTQRLRYARRNGQIVEELLWTANGEMVERREFVGGVLSRTTDYTYGLDGTLAGVTFTGGGSGLNDGSRIDYTYDHTGELIGRKLTAASGFVVSDERYLVDRQNLTGYSQRLAVIDGLTGAIKSFNTFTDQLAAQASVTGSAVTTSHLQTDGLGIVRACLRHAARTSTVGIMNLTGTGGDRKIKCGRAGNLG